LAEGQSSSGVDLGAMENPVEPVLAQITEEAVAESVDGDVEAPAEA